MRFLLWQRIITENSKDKTKVVRFSGKCKKSKVNPLAKIIKSLQKLHLRRLKGF